MNLFHASFLDKKKLIFRRIVDSKSWPYRSRSGYKIGGLFWDSSVRGHNRYWGQSELQFHIYPSISAQCLSICSENVIQIHTALFTRNINKHTNINTFKHTFTFIILENFLFNSLDPRVLMYDSLSSKNFSAMILVNAQISKETCSCSLKMDQCQSFLIFVKIYQLSTLFEILSVVEYIHSPVRKRR